MVVSWTLIGYGRAVAWELPILGTDFTLWRIVISLPIPVLAGALGRFVYVRIYPKGEPAVTLSALIIDVTLWGSVVVLGFMAWRRGRVVLVSSMREGSMDFVNIVPRIALGVIGSGYIAAVIPPEVITGWLGPDSGWFGVLTAVDRGRGHSGRPGGRLLDRRGSVESRRRPAAGDRLRGRLGAVRVPAHDPLGNPVHAGSLRLVSRGGFACRFRSWRRRSQWRSASREILNVTLWRRPDNRQGLGWAVLRPAGASCRPGRDRIRQRTDRASVFGCSMFVSENHYVLLRLAR